MLHVNSEIAAGETLDIPVLVRRYLRCFPRPELVPWNGLTDRQYTQRNGKDRKGNVPNESWRCIRHPA